MFFRFFISGSLAGLAIAVSLLVVVGPEFVGPVLGLEVWAIVGAPVLSGVVAGTAAVVLDRSDFAIGRGIVVSIVSFFTVCLIASLLIVVRLNFYALIDDHSPPASETIIFSVYSLIGVFFGYSVFGGLFFGWIVVIAGGVAGWWERKVRESGLE